MLAQLWLGAAGGESLEETGYIKADRHIFPLSFRALTTSRHTSLAWEGCVFGLFAAFFSVLDSEGFKAKKERENGMKTVM